MSEKVSIFQQVTKLAKVQLDNQLQKAKAAASPTSPDFVVGKAITKDRNHFYGSQGYQERPGAIGYEFQKHMAIKSSVIAAIIRTRQNEAASYAQPSNKADQKGFKIALKDEKTKLDEIKKELFGEDDKEIEGLKSKSAEEKTTEANEEIVKSSEPMTSDDFGLPESFEDEEPELTDQDKERAAKAELDKRTAKKRQAITEFIMNCGELKDRDFEDKRWRLNSLIRALVNDSLVYDQACMEIIPKEASKLEGKTNIHHFVPVDASTIRYASPELRKYKDSEMNLSQDILYPENELEALEERDALELDDKRLENDEYKYVQVVRGRIERAFTETEMCLGMRNPSTDLNANGYALSELEVLVGLVSSHLQTEHYNKSYFQQGFSAKGILHIKANLNRSKLEELRRHWTHMVKGNRNSFQTPIMSGMEEIQWLPLTQNHSEMEFSLWLNYLIKMICAIYQIDPTEIGYGMKEEGGSGGSMSGDNTEEKLEHSKSKGFVPLMRFLADFLNKNIVDHLDAEYQLEWVGIEDENAEARIGRQEREVKFLKSVNEVREESGLRPIKGADDLILDPNYLQWYTQFHEDGQALRDQEAQNAESTWDRENPEEDPQQGWDADEAAKENDHQRAMEMESHKADLTPEKVEKSVKIEYYKLDNDS